MLLFKIVLTNFLADFVMKGTELLKRGLSSSLSFGEKFTDLIIIIIIIIVYFP
jgi:hypothetical protein